MKLLHRHIFWSVGGTCLAAAGLFGFVLLLGNALKDLLGYLLAGQIPIETFLVLAGLLVPYVGAYALPIGVLTGVLLVLGRMSAQQEITAMRAAGLSLGFVARPIVVLGLIGAAATLVVNFSYMPRARAAYKQALARSVQLSPLSFVVPKTFVREFPGVVLYVGEKEGARLRDFWVWQVDDEARMRVFARADEGHFEYDQEANTLVLTLRHVVMESRNPEDPEDFTRPLATSAVEEFPIKLHLDALFDQQAYRRKLREMTLDQLLAKRARLAAPAEGSAEAELTPEERRVEAARVVLTLNDKASSAVTVLAFALLAVPLGIKVSRKETSANLGLALILVMAYYFATTAIGWLDQYPAARPHLLVWVPAAGFFVLAGWLFRRIGRV